MTTFEIRRQEKQTIAKTQPNRLAIYLLWILATTIGWSAGVFNLDFEAKTYLEVLRLLSVYLIDGLLIGLIMGLGQELVLRRMTHLNGEWVRATVLGYGLAFLMGVIVSVLIPSLVWLSHGEYLLPFMDASTVSIWLNIDDLFWGGILIGAVQWSVLKKIIPNPTLKKGLVWVLVTWFVLGASVYVRIFTHGNFLGEFQMGMMGMFIGIVTGLILLVILRPQDSMASN
jgi:hypothetical protein